MICVEVLSNNKLTVRNDTLATAVSDSIKHETVKFSFSDNWNNYQKTAVFSAEGVEPICVTLDRENLMCITEDECYIPHEVLQGDSFYLSVFGVNDDRLATATKAKIDVFESGYALGEEPLEPTPSEYSQIIAIMTKTQEIAQSVRDDADNGLFKGEKGDVGPQGEKGDKGDPYTLTEEDKNEIALKVQENMDGGVSSWNDLTDKPFYDEGTQTATIDYADTSSLVSFTTGGMTFYKVFNDALDNEKVIGSKHSTTITAEDSVSHIVSGEISTLTYTVDFPFGKAYINDVYLDAIGSDVEVIIAIAEIAGDFDNNGEVIAVPEIGTYIAVAILNETTATINSTTYEYALKQYLDNKYLEILSKTADVELLAEQELEFTLMDGLYAHTFETAPCTLVAGNKYKFVWDGAEYIYTAIDGDGAVFVGDFVAYNPFIMILNGGALVIGTADTSTTHTLSITQVGKYEVKQEYLPETLYTEIDQRIEAYIDEALGGEY